MKIDIFDIDKFVKVNRLQEIKNPIYLDRDKTPTTDGLFSYEIFGAPGTRERRERFAYIDLGMYILNPLMYKLLTRMDNRIKKISEGYSFYYVNSKSEIVEDPEQKNKNSGTGFEWLYKNLKNVKFKKTSSTSRNEKIDILNNLSREELFNKVWPVIPAFYRDLNFEKISYGKITLDEINNIYIKIINASNAIKKARGSDFSTNLTAIRLQLALVELQDELLKKVSGKSGMFRSSALGKSIDYSARTVISTSKIGLANEYTKKEVGTFTIGVPLHIACVTFLPFVVKNVRELLSDYLTGKTRVLFSKNSQIQKDANIIGETLTDKTIEKMIDFFAKSQEERFNTLELEGKDGKKITIPYLKDYIKRDLTLCDLLFLACYMAVKDKYVYYTRYPVDSHLSTNIGKPILLTTEKVITIDFKSGETESILGKIENYPDIKYKHLWRDATVIDNGVTGIMGADFDGDMVSIVGLFSQEANKEAEKITNSKTPLLKADGNPARGVSNEAVMSLYCLTKD
jgi:DNA-directed RNA polymerase beta' subunit